MMLYTLSSTGQVILTTGAACTETSVDAASITVPHLPPHVQRWTLPKGDSVGVLIRYSCHCWTSQHDPAHHKDEMKIMDGVRARVCDVARFEASQELPRLMQDLDRHRIYVTQSERNYGVYNLAFVAEDGMAYTAFFMIRPDRGRFNKARHSLTLTVESAYHTVQPQQGTKTSLTAVISNALQGKTVRYRR